MINKEPVYIQISKAIRQLIIRDQYAVGDKFLTERIICDQFNVSRSTANKSLSSLVSENILEFKKGIGTFIKSIPDTKNSYSLFTDPIELMINRQISYEVEFIELDSSFYGYFSVGDDRVSAIRTINSSNTVIAVEIIYQNTGYPGLFTNTNKKYSLISLLNNIPLLRILETRDSLHSKISSVTEMELFGVKKEIPLLEIISRSNMEEGHSILKTHTLYNGEIYSLDFADQSREINFKIRL